jgi:uncharacterized membrane protein
MSQVNQSVTADIAQPKVQSGVRDDRIFRETKWLSAIIVPFLVVAFYILYLRPTETKDLFAWEINPPMTPMMLGAVYIGGAYFFLRAVLAKKWHWIHLGFRPVACFAALLGIATLLHWDRFSHDHISFVAWVTLYFTTPFLVLAVWLRNRVTDPGTPEPDDVVVPQMVRYTLGVIGVTTFLVSLLLFLQPTLMISIWPWTLTPLTARVVGAMFMLGIAGVWLAREQRWSAWRIILQAQGFMLLMILTAALRAWNTDLHAANVASWVFVGGLVVVIVLIAVFYWRMEKQRSSSPVLP